MNLRKSGFTHHRANQDVGIQNNRSVAHFLFRCAFLGCLCTFTRRFEIGDYGFNINALSRQQSVQGCAGFLQRGNISIGLAVGRDEVANGLTMPCHHALGRAHARSHFALRQARVRACGNQFTGQLKLGRLCVIGLANAYR